VQKSAISFLIFGGSGMLHLLLTVLFIAVGGAADTADDTVQLAGVTANLVAEDQTRTGKFTTATEVKPILAMTEANWIAVREWDGNDLIYVSHLWALRCGLVQIEVGINGGGLEVWPLPPCHIDTAQPNGIIESDGLPYRVFTLKLIDRLDVRLTLDDLTTQEASFARKDILIP
jgi:hypothetical protein